MFAFLGSLLGVTALKAAEITLAVGSALISVETVIDRISEKGEED